MNFFRIGQEDSHYIISKFDIQLVDYQIGEEKLKLRVVTRNVILCFFFSKEYEEEFMRNQTEYVVNFKNRKDTILNIPVLRQMEKYLI